MPDPFPNSIFNKGQEVNGGLFLEWAALPNETEKDLSRYKDKTEELYDVRKNPNEWTNLTSDGTRELRLH